MISRASFLQTCSVNMQGKTAPVQESERCENMPQVMTLPDVIENLGEETLREFRNEKEHCDAENDVKRKDTMQEKFNIRFV